MVGMLANPSSFTIVNLVVWANGSCPPDAKCELSLFALFYSVIRGPSLGAPVMIVCIEY